MKSFLGIDGGGSKTHFLLIDERGRVLASHLEGPSYHLEIGIEALRALLTRGIRATLRQGGVSQRDLTYAFAGLPAYGEDRVAQSALDAAPADALVPGGYRCGNDMVCGWAGARAGADGINLVAGTGSIAYGEFGGRSARAGGWGEIFSDEGSAFWMAREGLRLFSRMSDGRSKRGPLHEKIRHHFHLQEDLELCAAIYGTPMAQRSHFAQLARLVSDAAAEGDPQARELFALAARELAQMADAVRVELRVPSTLALPVSYSGGMFQSGDLLTGALEQELAAPGRHYHFSAARLPPHAGAAIYAAKLAGFSLRAEDLSALAGALASPVSN